MDGGVNDRYVPFDPVGVVVQFGRIVLLAGLAENSKQPVD
jgi:hypothetical protein